MKVPDRASWYYYRLRAMSPAEVGHRIRERLTERAAAEVGRRPVAALQPRPVDPATDVVHVFGQLRATTPPEPAERVAESLRRGVVTVLGHDWDARRHDWAEDPRTGGRWPLVPARRVSYRGAGTSDPKWTWEVNRLAFLLALVDAPESITVAGDRDLVDELVASWLDDVPAGRGVAWASSIEVALRAIVLTLLCRLEPGLSPRTRDRCARSLAEHAHWLTLFPSKYSSANNHRLAEVMGLLVLLSHWDGLDPELVADRAALEAECLAVATSLFAEDGIGREESPTYSGFAIELAAIAYRCHDWADPGRRAALGELLAGACDTLVQFTTPDGALMTYGDNDEARVFTVITSSDDYAGALTRLVGVPTARRRNGLSTFAAGGHSVVRASELGVETTWMFDHAPLGFGALAAHGHADALSVSLYLAGAEWIVDPGTFCYHDQRDVRDWFRSSAAHNAPTLDGRDASVPTGSFNWHPRYRAQARLTRSVADGERWEVSAEHDGYRRQGIGPLVRRTLTRTAAARYTIVDECDPTERSLQTRFAVHPDCRIEPDPGPAPDGATGWVVRRAGSPIRVRLRVCEAVSAQLVGADDEQLWYSPAFGTRVPTSGLALVARPGRQAQRIEIEFTLECS